MLMMLVAKERVDGLLASSAWLLLFLLMSLLAQKVGAQVLDVDTRRAKILNAKAAMAAKVLVPAMMLTATRKMKAV
jgi:hypothetical protein